MNRKKIPRSIVYKIFSLTFTVEDDKLFIILEFKYVIPVYKIIKSRHLTF